MKSQTALNNDIVNNACLSLKAKGLVWFLLTRPQGWKTSLIKLSETLPESKNSLRTALKELEDEGFIRWSKDKVTGATVMDVYETSRPNPNLAQDRESRRPQHKA